MNIKQNLVAFVCNLILAATLINGSTDHERKAYIVYMGDMSDDRATISVMEEHHGLLSKAIGDEKIARKSRIYSYGKSFNGFVARLLPQEAQRLSEDENVVSVFPNTIRKLHTTRSWDFLGMTKTIKRSQLESNIIVAVLDTGIYVKSPSFNDKGFGPPPAKWKGKCVTGRNFTGCNNKVIGARYYNLDNAADPDRDNISPADTDGHGSHTSSTAAGVTVNGASLYGLAKGTARGGVPSARIAVYKVCWNGGCTDMDLLAAFDDAIHDGVDVISISIGGSPRSFLDDPIAIGSFHAMKKGILTSCSAGNDGPYPGTVQNIAPWIVTVAATSSDRKFETALKLGNGDTVSGISVNTFSPRKKMYPLTNGAHAANTTASNYGNFSACDYGTLSKDKVKGKIVYCLGSSRQDYFIKLLEGAGTIMVLDEPSDIAFTTLISATTVLVKQGIKIDRYINSTKNPQAVIYKTKTVNTTAPFLASFSSRGPQTINLNILKPDIAAPATPLKIKPEDAELGSGSGQINPRRAAHPGLVYDITMSSYISFLCKEGYNDTNIGKLIGGKEKQTCSSFKPALGTDGLNYPSMHTQLNVTASRISAVFYRTVTHVGFGNSVYNAIVTSPKGLSVQVLPSTLKFNKLHQQKSFKVVVKGGPMKNGTQILSALLEWSDSRHSVKSPILIYKPIPLSG
ncbi:hypothetical protein QYF36_025989 [Acer negundo]|nr:hypothetical protein QYF36_025989 [Acer negundo]